jgi:hypothetical protein
MRSGMFAVLIVGALWACLATPGTVRAGTIEDYCCLCANCTTGNAFQCTRVAANGGSAATPFCTSACTALNCQLGSVLEGACALVAACPEHTRAPALSPVVLGLLMVGLGGWGVYRVKRGGLEDQG